MERVEEVKGGGGIRWGKKIAGEETVPEWISLNSGDKNIKINCLDVITKAD